VGVSRRPSSPGIGGGGATFRYHLLYEAATKVTVDSDNNGKGKRRRGRNWFRVRRCVSLPNRNRRLSPELLAGLTLSFRSVFFFFLFFFLIER
jgi:hypothetical protein